MFSLKRGVVGLDIGSSSVKAIELRPKGTTFELLSMGYADLQADTIVDGQIIDLNHVSDSINMIFADQKIKNQRVATSVAGHSVIAKKLTLPLMSEEELEAQVQWEAEQHIPFALPEVNLYHEILEFLPDGQNMDVLLVACKRDKLGQFGQVISHAGKTPAIIDVDAFALQNCYIANYQPPANTTVALLDIGAAVMTINVLRGSSSIFTRDVSVGGNHYTDLLQREMNLTFEEAESLKRGASLENGITPEDARPLVHSVSEVLGMEIQKTLDFFRSTVGPDADHIDRMLLSGGSAKVAGLSTYLSERFGIPVELFDSFRNVQFSNKKFDREFMQEMSPNMAVAVGLALRGSEV